MLSFLRTGTAVALMPVFGYQAVPVQVKAGIAFVIALVLTPVAHMHLVQAPPGVLPLAAAAISEVMVGLLFGLVTLLVLVGAQFAGTIIGFQMGFGIVQVIDPSLGGRVSIIGQLQYLVALMIFITLNVHHSFLRALGESFELIPLGGAVFPPAMALSYGQLTAEVFVIAIKLGAPVIAMLLLTQITLAFVARMLPRMNVFIVAFPLKIGLGLLGLALTWPLFLYVIDKVFNRFVQVLREFIGVMAGL